jgi:general secretion pathway protein G
MRLEDMRYVCWLGCLLVVALSACAIDTRLRPSEELKQRASRVQIANFQTALGAYRLDVGDYPSTAEGLQALRVNPGHPGWNGPYMPQDIPRDPWGVPYGYVYVSGKPEIASSSPAGSK